MHLPSVDDLTGSLHRLLAPCVAQDWPNLSIARGEGSCLYSPDGRRYLDFLSGFGACPIGHNHPRVVSAARDQIEQLIHAPAGVIAHEKVLQLAWQLGQVTPGDIDMFFLSNSGAEAVEAALKLARSVTGRRGILCFLGGFHGRTMGALSATTSKVGYRTGSAPFLPEVYFARFPYPFRSDAPDPETCAEEALEDIHRLFRHVVAPEDIAAMLVEPVQGEGGYVIPPRSWLASLRRICDQHGILLVFDEVQTGFGRTGEWFAAQAFGVNPDIICMAKGIASGFPLGAAGAPRELMGRWSPAAHGTTFGGNPVSCAAALATLAVIEEEGVLEDSRTRGAHMLKVLSDLPTDYPIVGEVRGIGMMVAVEFIEPGTRREPNPAAVRRILTRALDEGLLMYPCGHWTQTIRLIPPLNIPQAALDEGLGILRGAISAEHS